MNTKKLKSQIVGNPEKGSGKGKQGTGKVLKTKRFRIFDEDAEAMKISKLMTSAHLMSMPIKIGCRYEEEIEFEDFE